MAEKKYQLQRKSPQQRKSPLSSEKKIYDADGNSVDLF